MAQNYIGFTIISLNANKNEDEKISFFPFQSNGVFMCKVQHIIPGEQFDDKYSETTQKKYECIYPMSDIYEYVRTILLLITSDDAPSDEYQFNLPGIPIILVKHSKINSIYSIVLDHIYYISKNEYSWPKKVSGHDVMPSLDYSHSDHHHSHHHHSTLKSRTKSSSKPNTHLFFDEDGYIM